jgi:hypothetical protein
MAQHRWRRRVCRGCGRTKKVAFGTGYCWQCSQKPLPAPAPVKCKYCRLFDEIEKMHKDVITEEYYHRSCANDALMPFKGWVLSHTPS